MYDADGIAPLWLGASTVGVFWPDLSAVLLTLAGTVAFSILVIRFAGRWRGEGR